MVDVTLMPIGRFAAASRLSVKSLRNYDDSGLLPAAYVDPQSGYRYYRLQQLARAEVVRTLRLLDMPLASIAEVLDDEGSPDGLLESHLAELVRQRDDYDKKVRQLKRLRSRREITMSNTVSIKTIAPQVVATYRVQTSYEDTFAAIPDGFQRVLEFLEANNSGPVGAPFTLFYAPPEADADGDIAMAVPVASLLADLDAEEMKKAGVEVIELPGGAVASIMHKGSYAEMGDTYASIGMWVHQHGHSQVGPGREIYMNNPADVPESELLTEIQWPIDAESV